MFDVATLGSFYLADKVSTYTKDYAENSRIIKPFLDKFTPLLLPILLPSVQRSSKDGILTKLKSPKKQHKILFGFGGRFVEEKGFDILFKAIPLVIKKLPQAHFVFAGETNMEYEKTFDNFKFQISNLKQKITMLGLLNDDELSQFYQNIDYVVIPSRSDCFPLFQAEAMLYGKPSIVANIPGARYLVRKTGFGTIFAKENPSDLADKILETIKKGEQLEKNYGNIKKILDPKENAKNARKYIEE